MPPNMEKFYDPKYDLGDENDKESFRFFFYFGFLGRSGMLNQAQNLYTRWYEFWSSKVCEGDLLTCWICIPNEFWSTCEASHIFGGFSDHVLKMKFGPLSNCRQNELCSTFVPMIASKIKSGSKFILAAIWKWIKLYFKHVIRKQPNNMLYLASGSKFIWYAYPTRD